MKNDKGEGYAVWAACMLAAGIFVADLFTLLASVEWVLYIAVSLLAAQHVGKRGTLLFAGLCTALTAGGYFLSFHGLESREAMIHRSMGIAVLWLTAWLMVSGRRSRQARMNHALLRAVIEGPASGMVCVKDLQGRVILANPAILQMLGRSEDEVIGKDDLDSLPNAELVAKIRANDRRVMEEGVAIREEETIDTKGSRWTCLFHKSPLRDAQGRVIGILGVGTDITDRKRAEDALHESMERLAELSTNLVDGMVYQIDSGPDGRDRRFSVLSPAIEHLHGLTVEAVQQDANLLYAQVLEEDRARVADAEARAFAARTRLEADVRVRLPSGEVRWRRFTSSPRRGKAGTWLWDGIEVDITDRKRAEEALAASERKYRLLHETMMDAFVRLDMEGRILEFNHVYQRMLGYDAQEICRLTQKDLTPEAWHAFKEEIVRTQILPLGHSAVYSMEYRRKDGTVFPVELRTFLLRDEAGKPEGMWSIVRDITERRQAVALIRQARDDLAKRVAERTAELAGTVKMLQEEVAGRQRIQEELAGNREKLHSVLASMDDLLFVLDREGHYTDYYQPPESSKLYAPPGVFLGKHFRDVLPADVAEKCAGVFDAAVTTGAVQEVDYALDVPEGRHWFNVKCSPRRDAKGQIVGALHVVRDITERVQAQEALRLTQFTVDKAIDAVFWLEPDGGFFYANDMACRMLGYSREELRRMTASDVNPGHPKEAWPAHWRDLERGGSMVFEASLRRKGGDTVEVEIAANYLKFGQKEYDCSYVRDITQRKRDERALREAQGKLVSARETERHRLATELHDSVAQDIVALQLMLETICSSLGNRKTASGDSLRVAVERCTRLARDVREICQGLYPQTLELFGLAPTLRQLAENCTQVGLVTELIIDPRVASRRFSPDVEIAVFRIAQEAAANAVKHSEAHHLSVELSKDDDKNTLVLAVTDNGKGFNPDLRTPAGLGLVSMCERAEAVGGILTIDSHAGGTTVFLGVPVE